MEQQRVHFQDQDVHIDGGVYRDCEFLRCRIVFSGGDPPVLEGCRFVNCRWVFGDAAARTIGLMAALYSAGWQRMIEATFDNIRGKSAPGVTLN